MNLIMRRALTSAIATIALCSAGSATADDLANCRRQDLSGKWLAIFETDKRFFCRFEIDSGGEIHEGASVCVLSFDDETRAKNAARGPLMEAAVRNAIDGEFELKKHNCRVVGAMWNNEDTGKTDVPSEEDIVDVFAQLSADRSSINGVINVEGEVGRLSMSRLR